MLHAWRWFGPNAPVALDHVRQAEASDVVFALHHLPLECFGPALNLVARDPRFEGALTAAYTQLLMRGARNAAAQLTSCAGT